MVYGVAGGEFKVLYSPFHNRHCGLKEIYLRILDWEMSNMLGT